MAAASRSLARLSLDQALPFAHRVWGRARESLDGWAARFVGHDLEQRIRDAAVHLGDTGIDPFGLDHHGRQSTTTARREEKRSSPSDDASTTTMSPTRGT